MDEQLPGLSEETVSALRQLAEICRVDMDWLIFHHREGLLGDITAGAMSDALPERIRSRVCRMYEFERDFEAVPEFAALVAEFLDELDALRAERHRNEHWRGFS